MLVVQCYAVQTCLAAGAAAGGHEQVMSQCCRRIDTAAVALAYTGMTLRCDHQTLTRRTQQETVDKSQHTGYPSWYCQSMPVEE